MFCTLVKEMEAIKHLLRLKTFSVNDAISLLESMDYLREKNLLPPLWVALEEKITHQFMESEINKVGWAWQLDDTDLPLFSAWKFNAYHPKNGSFCNMEISMSQQLNLARLELVRIMKVESSDCNPRKEEMVKELEQVFLQIRSQIIKEAEALSF